ncbi:hypothetical protein QR98_0018820 [Sarcoptes scabiei]|uniref:Uncharacterized protein n=1 Tax=Sarcoptes scabiei TaxID=52283 RepID=A0A131ZZA5_SARSC|nr:hypothetical protein QR98_0018820 [Sarcoptes scabiei]
MDLKICNEVACGRSSLEFLSKSVAVEVLIKLSTERLYKDEFPIVLIAYLLIATDSPIKIDCTINASPADFLVKLDCLPFNEIILNDSSQNFVMFRFKYPLSIALNPKQRNHIIR